MLMCSSFFFWRHNGKRRPNYSAKPIKFNVRLRVDSLVGCSRPITHVVIYIHMYIHRYICCYAPTRTYACVCMNVHKYLCPYLYLMLYVKDSILCRLCSNIQLCTYMCVQCSVHAEEIIDTHRCVCMYYISVFTLALGSLGCQWHHKIDGLHANKNSVFERPRTQQKNLLGVGKYTYTMCM